MTSRLYPTTRRLFKQVFRGLKALGLRAVKERLRMQVFTSGFLPSAPLKGKVAVFN